MKFLNRVISHTFIATTIFFACGCAHETIDRSAIATNSEARVTNFTVRMRYSHVGGIVTEARHSILGTIIIDLDNNQILWQMGSSQLGPKILLQFVNRTLFFIEEKHPNLRFTALLSIEGRSTDGKNAVAIKRDASAEGVTLVELGQTPDGSFDEFFSCFNRLKFPDDYYALVATAKYVDGTPIPIGYELPASFQLIGKECLLNKRSAHFYRSTLENGKGVIVVNNGDSDLVLWPDGSWIFYNLDNSGTRFSGADHSLMQLYSDLRKQAETPAVQQ
jgi:hypothetical protein